MTSIAIFSTYQPSEGFGGPARIYHERVALEAVGHHVVHVVLEGTHQRHSMRRHDFVHTVERPAGAPIDHIYHDVDLARRATADQRLARSITDHLREQAVTLVILEQPFLIDVVEPIARALGAAIIYSSQNIEYRLRRDLERFQPDPRRPVTRADEVRALELRAVAAASAVTAICQTDRAAMFAEFGCDSVIVPNGSVIAQIDAAGPRASGPDTEFVFAGSAYWPNTEGFAQIATPSLAFLPPTVRIQVAGTVGLRLLDVPDIARHHSINASRVALRGFLEMGELAMLMASARAVLVPVFIGEGSNLKSADALACGAPVIMTRRATRGYEDVLAADDQGVTVVDDAASFREAMAAALGRERPQAPVGSERRRRLSWSSRMAPLEALVARVSR